jgi:hypothetical protein
VGESEHTVVKASGKDAPQIDWRKLLVPTLFVMVLPTITAIIVDKWYGSFPFITIAAIIICFPLSTFLVTRIALSEMDRVIAEVAPPLPPEEQPESGVASEEALPSDAEPPGEVPTNQEVGLESSPASSSEKF